MKYIEVDLGEETKEPKNRNILDSLGGLIIRVLSKILPEANPDFDHLYGKVRVVWLEVGKKGHPCREIGFDKDGNAIVLGPIDRNYGFITDSLELFGDEFENNPEIESKFEALWDEMERRFYEPKAPDNRSKRNEP
jgi:hypothetical protein